MLKKILGIILMLTVILSSFTIVFADDTDPYSDWDEKWNDWTYIFTENEIASFDMKHKIFAIAHNQAILNTNSPEEAKEYFYKNSQASTRDPQASVPIAIPGLAEAVKKAVDALSKIAIIFEVISLAYLGVRMICGAKFEEIKSVLKASIAALLIILLVPTLVVTTIRLIKPYAWDPTLGNPTIQNAVEQDF